MTIAEILKAKDVSDDIIQSVQEDMKTNKIFTASEENLDIRYGKLKTEHDGKLQELTEAQNLIAELKKSNKGNEDLQSKIATYEAQNAKLQEELKKTKIDAAIKVSLLAAKALDVDYLTFKLKEKGEIELDESGNIKGWDDKLTALKTQLPTQFEAAGDKRVIENKLQSGDKTPPTVTREQFLGMDYDARLKLKQKNEQLYKQLAKI